MKINGTVVTLQGEITLLEYLQQSQYDCLKIAVERNGEIVPRAGYANVVLQQQDVLEIVRFVGGG
ncbi:MAG: sulfur carrier protein ThiS [Clostridiales bacterium]|nr:sulfur carrier protein ThiS [Clostridiales bacterium]